MTRRYKTSLTLAAMVVWCAFLLGAFPAVSAAGPADRLEAYLKGLTTLVSEFEQITLGADGGRMVESKGTLYLKRPGRFRWEYRSPLEQIIVADGKRVWLHDVELDQVSHQSQASALSGTPAQLLSTDQPIERHFRVLPWDGGNGREWVELQPKDADSQVVKIRIGFIGDAMDTLLMEDSFGQITRFTFTETRRNPNLDDKLFRLDRPIGGDFLEFR